MTRKHINYRVLRSNWAAFFLLIGLVPGIMQSCRKPEDKIGVEVQPEDEDLDVVVIDTTSMITYTDRADSLRTSNVSKNLLGSYSDPEIGSVKSSIYTQVRTSSNNVVFDPDSIAIDSVVLSLKYDGFYGNLDPQTFRVYELTEDIYDDSAYYTNSTVNADSANDIVEPGFETITPDPFSTVVVGSDSAAPAQLRIRLKNSYASDIINANPLDLATPDDFVLFKKGLLVTVDNGVQGNEEGGILYFDLEDDYSKVTIYYRDTVDGVEDTTSFDLIINSNSARFHNVEHQYSSQIQAQLADSTLGMEFSYVQSLAGLKTFFVFPHIGNLIDSGMVIINRAELVIPIQYYEYSNLFPHDDLFILTLNEDGEEVFIDDWTLGTSIYGGSLDIENKEYRFNITRFIQNYLSGEVPMNELRLVAGESSISANRVVVNGAACPNRRQPKLKLTYTRY